MTGTHHVYTAESQVRHGRRLFRTVFKGFVSSRYMAWRLFIKDIKAEYTRSAFGVFWDFADPLVLAGIFYFLMRRGIIDVGNLGMPMALYVIYGVLLYQTFIESILFSVALIRNSQSLISQLRIPPEALVLSCIYRVGFFSIFRIGILLGFSLLILRESFSIPGFLAFVALFPLLALPGLAIGVLLAPFSVIYNDVQRAIRLVVMPLRYLSPVMWPIPWVWMNAINPIAVTMDSLRKLANSGVLDQAPGLAIRAAVFALIFIVGSITFHLSVPILSHRN